MVMISQYPYSSFVIKQEDLIQSRGFENVAGMDKEYGGSSCYTIPQGPQWDGKDKKQDGGINYKPLRAPLRLPGHPPSTQASPNLGLYLQPISPHMANS
jgi:hypothetical protein